MEKKLYDLTINESLEKAMPPLRDMELTLLERSLLTEGCRDPLVVWDGTIVDGHNRYRICHEHGIPFCYIEQEFQSESAAKLWVIRNQLARRNVPDFVRCELVLPLEAELKAEAKKRQGWRNGNKNLPQNSAEGGKRTETREALADLAGVSRDTITRAKKLINGADDETIERLRSGDVSIHKAYTAMRGNKRTQPAVESESAKGAEFEKSAVAERHAVAGSHSPLKPKETVKPTPHEGKDAYGFNNVIQSLPQVGYTRPSDSVYDAPPTTVFGNMPADNAEMRGRAEMAQARSDLEYSTKYYVRRVGEIMRSMTEASRNEENLQMLRDIVARSYAEIAELMK